MREIIRNLLVFTFLLSKVNSNDVIGCGGFVKSHVQIDFSKIEVKLLTGQGILKDKTTCAPNNGYYFLPIYDKGDYVLELNPPPGWSFNRTKVQITIDRVNDLCSKGVDINFHFKGFGIAGRVESLGDPTNGPEGVTVELSFQNEVLTTETSVGGIFSFTPVYPGNYKIKVKHPRWKLLKDELQVKVTEGNTDLSQGSFIVHGFKVSGYARSEKEAVSNTTIMIFWDKTKSNVNYPNHILGCEPPNELVKKLSENLKPLLICHVKTDSNGKFSFESVVVGSYFVMPFYLNQNIDVNPPKIAFKVSTSDLALDQSFEVIGFSVVGKVVKSQESNEGLRNAKIYLNGKLVAKTNSEGSYKLEKLKTGQFKIKAESESFLFDELSIKITPNLQFLPNISPSSFKICGRVDSSQTELVTIVKVGSTLLKNVESDAETGIFCEFLPRGTYEIQVQKRDGKSIQFYPISQKVDVINYDYNIIVFSQLKAKVVGKVQCYKESDCEDIQVTLSRNGDKEITTELRGPNYEFNDVFPGLYKLSLPQSRYCWLKDSHEIMVNSINVKAPLFIQNGYSINFSSSHNTKVSYKLIGDSIKEEIELKKGQSSYCLPKEGSYIFEYLGCHSYQTKTSTYNTETEPNEIKLEAIAHLNKICISSMENHGPVTVSIDIDGEKIQKGPLPYENGCYMLELTLEPEMNAIILPQSDVYYFKPPIFSVKGTNDCSQHNQMALAVKGHVFKGKIIPALPGTLISLEDADGESSTTETDSAGFYKFPPMDQTIKYKITAKKDSYQLVGPNENGDFTAYKLAQVIVKVLDENDKTPLQGALLSLSGGLSYRSNLQTDENGVITFHSLNPSEYYLKPRMKEYSFNPPSKIIHVEEGEVVNISLIGKRVAHSAFGVVTSLNSIPEHNSIVEAIGVGNCSQFSEETTTEQDGKFRIRGLMPYCTYHLKTKDPSVEQCIPEFIEIKDVVRDVENLNLIILRPKKHTKVMVRICSEFPEYSKMLKLNVYMKGSHSNNPIHSLKLDSYVKSGKEYNPGLMVYLPSLPKDGKTYTVQLEMTINQNFKWISQGVSFVANSCVKVVQLNYVIISNATEQQIQQFSVWKFVLYFVFVVISLIVLSSLWVVIRMLKCFGSKF